MVRSLVIAAIVVVCSAHVGTLDAFFAGHAGPYPVQVTVRPPGVVPGLAQITVRVDGVDVRRVTTQAAVWHLGSAGAPPPDEAKPVPGSPGLYSSQLWLMTRGSYSVNVGVDGAAGAGIVRVPVSSVATQRLPMKTGLAIPLAALGLFLFVGMLTVVGAAAREGILLPGEVADGGRRRSARRAIAVAAVILVMLVAGGWRWWNSVDERYRAGIFRPYRASTAVRAERSARVLRLRIDDTTYNPRRAMPLIPDHGKMMHLFLVREPALDAFAHLHPALIDSATFDAQLGDLPAGRYRVYADILHLSGFTQTIIAGADVPAPDAPSSSLGDVDDATFFGAVTASTGDTALLGDGLRMVWRRPAVLRAQGDTPLRFTALEPDGSVATLEPYLGMPGHAMVTRADGSVFMHLHGMGSVSPTAVRVIEAVERGDTLPSVREFRSPRAAFLDSAASMPAHASMKAGGVLTFPFSFPRPGTYRLWVQVKRKGTIHTAAFDADVSTANAR